MVGEPKKLTLHPAFVQRALDAEAEAWALETNVDRWLSRFSSDPRTVAKLREIAVLAFTEGLHRGVINCKSGKPLSVSVDEAIALDAEYVVPSGSDGRIAHGTASAGDGRDGEGGRG